MRRGRTFPDDHEDDGFALLLSMEWIAGGTRVPAPDVRRDPCISDIIISRMRPAEDWSDGFPEIVWDVLPLVLVLLLVLLLLPLVLLLLKLSSKPGQPKRVLVVFSFSLVPPMPTVEAAEAARTRSISSLASTFL